MCDQGRYCFIFVTESDKYCDRLAMQSLVGIIISKIAMSFSIEDMESTYFGRLTMTMVDSLSQIDADKERPKTVA